LNFNERTTISHVEAAAIPLPALSAWQALFDHGHLRSEERGWEALASSIHIRASSVPATLCTRLYARAADAIRDERENGSREPSRRRDSNPRPPLYEGDLGPGTDDA
jgi:hypothetical protein